MLAYTANQHLPEELVIVLLLVVFCTPAGISRGSADLAGFPSGRGPGGNAESFTPGGSASIPGGSADSTGPGGNAELADTPGGSGGPRTDAESGTLGGRASE